MATVAIAAAVVAKVEAETVVVRETPVLEVIVAVDHERVQVVATSVLASNFFGGHLFYR